MGSPRACTLPGSYKLCPFCRAPNQCCGPGWRLPRLLDLRALLYRILWSPTWSQRYEGGPVARLKGGPLLHHVLWMCQGKAGGFGPGGQGGQKRGTMSCGSLSGMLQGGSKVLDRGEALLGLFGERSQHHFLKGRREGWNLLTQGWRRSSQVLGHDLRQRPPKRAIPSEPFVDDNAQRILVTGWARLALNLFRSYIVGCSRDLLDALRERMPGEHAQAKVTEQDVKTLVE